MSTSLRGMYCTAAYAASCSVKASRVSATVRPPTDTMTRNGFALIVIGWSGPGTLIGLGVMASIPLVPELARSLLSCLATVDADDLAGAEVGFVGRQEHDGLGDLFGLTCTLRRHARHQAGFPVGIARKAVQHLGFDRTGGDRVDAHASRCAFERGHFRQHFDCVLAGNIHRRARCTAAAQG